MLLLMKKIRLLSSKHIFIIIYLLLIGIFSIGSIHAKEPELWKLIDPINDVIRSGNTEKSVFKSAIKTFCQTVSNQWEIFSISGDIVYNANKSLFMYTMCSDTQIQAENTYFNKSEWFTEDKNTSYIHIYIDTDGNLRNNFRENLPDIYSNTENYIKEVFDTIIESYTSIYQAGIYWYAPNKDNEELINKFSEKYFPYITSTPKHLKICGNDQEYRYNKTCKKFKEYINEARQTYKNSNNILNTDLIYANSSKKACQQKDKWYDMIACSLYSGDLSDFINLVYNELFFYNLFTEYYKIILEIQPNFKTRDEADIFKKTAKQAKRIEDIEYDIAESREAIKITIRLLKEIQMTFPLHIGFLLYTEDINTFATAFNKLLPPIYTIYDLFRNVQIKEG